MQGTNFKKVRHLKYGNKPCGGYASRLEREDGIYLKSLLQDGKIADVKEQVNYDLTCNGMLICRHIPDFLVTLLDGRQKIVESKGFATREWEIKRKLFIANFPDVEYITSTKVKPIWLHEQDLLR